MMKMWGWLRNPHKRPWFDPSIHAGFTAGSPALEETQEEPPKKPEKPGLRRAFAIGEILPWKGIAFKVEGVGFDVITLKAHGMTMQRARAVHHART